MSEPAAECRNGSQMKRAFDYPLKVPTNNGYPKIVRRKE